MMNQTEKKRHQQKNEIQDEIQLKRFKNSAASLVP